MKTKIIEVDKRDPKIAFILANTFRKTLKNYNENDVLDLQKKYDKWKKHYFSLTTSQLDFKIEDKVRLKRYDSMDWFKGELPLEEMGVWPEMKGLETSLTIGNVPETAEGVKEVIEGSKDFYVPSKFLSKLESMKQFPFFIYNNFPIIVFPGGEIREKDRNEWLRNNNLDSPEHNIFEYDIDDGCSRSVFYWLFGIRSVPSFIGKYKK